VDAGRRDAEEALEVGLGGRQTIEQDVRVDEGVNRGADALDMPSPI
jgi:hypothetical protein